MESQLIINNFDQLTKDKQEQIKKSIFKITKDVKIDIFTNCDCCNEIAIVKPIETEGGIMRICDNCIKTQTNKFDKSLFDFKK